MNLVKFIKRLFENRTCLSIHPIQLFIHFLHSQEHTEIWTVRCLSISWTHQNATHKKLCENLVALATALVSNYELSTQHALGVEAQRDLNVNFSIVRTLSTLFELLLKIKLSIKNSWVMSEKQKGFWPFSTRYYKFRRSMHKNFKFFPAPSFVVSACLSSTFSAMERAWVIRRIMPILYLCLIGTGQSIASISTDFEGIVVWKLEHRKIKSNILHTQWTEVILRLFYLCSTKISTFSSCYEFEEGNAWNKKMIKVPWLFPYPQLW